MTTKEILQAVLSHWQASEVLLVREGLFWRTYEQSALALCKSSIYCIFAPDKFGKVSCLTK